VTKPSRSAFLLIFCALLAIMGKRANQTAGKSNKKAKTDPVLVSIADAINQADHLPERCRAMLVDMLPFSLSVASDKRHESQTWAVGTVEQTLNAQKALLEAAIVVEDEKLATLKASESSLASTVTEAEVALVAQKEAVQSAEGARTEATEAATTAGNALVAAQEEQKTGEVTLATAQEEKVALESAFEAHFKVPFEEGNGPHFKELQPFLKQIEMEASLLKACPSSCAKSKDDRGSFDEVVLQELGKALSSKVTALGEVVAVETPAAADRATAVQTAENDHNAKKEAQKQFEEALEGAQKEQAEREAALATATNAVEEFQPQVEAMTALADKAKLALASLEAGALTGFTTYMNRVEVSTEVAVAGA